jgi:hypothetical protein
MNDLLTLNRLASSLCEPSLFCHAVRIFFLSLWNMLLPSLYFFILPFYFTIIVVHLIAICCKFLAAQSGQEMSSLVEKSLAQYLQQFNPDDNL